MAVFDKDVKKIKWTDFDAVTLTSNTRLKCKYGNCFYCTSSLLAQRK